MKYPRPAKSFIYALCDPISGVIKYIGQSVNPKRRHRQHLFFTKGKVGDWIKNLKGRCLEPKLLILGCFSEKTISCHENRFIEKYKNTLLNSRSACNAYMPGGRKGQLVLCIETGERFTSYASAARKYRCSPGSIINRCKDGGDAYPSGMHFKEVNDR